MWDARTESGEIQEQPTEAWQSGLEFVKLKALISDETFCEMIKEHMWDNHGNLMEEFGYKDIYVKPSTDIYAYLNINTRTGEMVMVGIDGHPIDKTKMLK